jgi:hypothetical protein
MMINVNKGKSPYPCYVQWSRKTYNYFPNYISKVDGSIYFTQILLTEQKINRFVLPRPLSFISIKH